VNQASTPNITYSARATGYLRSSSEPVRVPGSASRIAKPLTTQKTWCTGEDSNLRSSKERQIYSLLPLTARPPVPCHPNDQNLSFGTALCPAAGTLSAHQPPSGTFRLPRIVRHVLHATGVGSPQEQARRACFRAGKTRVPFRFPNVLKWSWRRDLNPRPSDYKSDALPAELRQPFRRRRPWRKPPRPPGKPSGKLKNHAHTLSLRMFFGTELKVSTRLTAEQTCGNP